MGIMFMAMTPELPVSDVVETQEYFRNVLDFEIDWLWEDGNYGSVSKEQVSLFFCKYAQPIAGFCCYITVEDADAIYGLYQSRNVEIVSEIGDKPWQMREFTIKDLNGHFFRIGHFLGEEEEHEAA
jgi:hypothetical protein